MRANPFIPSWLRSVQRFITASYAYRHNSLRISERRSEDRRLALALPEGEVEGGVGIAESSISLRNPGHWLPPR